MANQPRLILSKVKIREKKKNRDCFFFQESKALLLYLILFAYLFFSYSILIFSYALTDEKNARRASHASARFGGNVDACVVVLVIDIDNDNVSFLLLLFFPKLFSSNESLRFIFSSR
jgi:hypothetical protein